VEYVALVVSYGPLTRSTGTITPADGNALTSFTHPYRFSKMHSKVSGGLLDEIEPCVVAGTRLSIHLIERMRRFAFRGEKIQNKGEVTACLYTNEAWLAMLPEFVKRWNGPLHVARLRSGLSSCGRAHLARLRKPARPE
jgi:hypothetical protein